MGPQEAAPIGFSTPYGATGSLEIATSPDKLSRSSPVETQGATSPLPGAPNVGTPVGATCASVPLSPVGCEAWSATYDNPEGSLGFDMATGVAIAPSGERSYVVGFSLAGTSYDMFTVAYDVTTGAELWSQRYDGPAGLNDFAGAVTVSPDGSRVYVAGIVDSYDKGTGSGHYGIVAYSATDGARLWTAGYAGPLFLDRPSQIVVDPDGSRLFVTGFSWGGYESEGGTNMDVVTIAYDSVSGDQIWTERFDGGRSDGAYGMTVGPDGRVYVSGYSVASTGVNALAISYDGETGTVGGQPLWIFRHNFVDTGTDIFGQVVVSADVERLYATGNGNTVALDISTGELSWRNINMADGVYFGSLALSTSEGPTGEGVFVGGRASQGPPFNEDFATSAYDGESGAQLWGAIADGPGTRGHFDPDTYNFPMHAEHEWLTGIAASPSGDRVYVTGLSGDFPRACTQVNGETGCMADVAFRTVAYDTLNGREVWARTYGIPLSAVEAHVPASIAVTPEGTVVVTGWHEEWFSDDAAFGSSRGLQEDYGDAITIAYQDSTLIDSVPSPP